MLRHDAIAAPAAAKALARGVCVLLVALVCLVSAHAPAAAALKAIDVTPDADRIDISEAGEYYEPQGDQITIDSAPGRDSVTQRVQANASSPGTSPGWFAFALRNSTDKTVERWLVIDRYSMAGSGVVWPDLDARRVEKISHS